MRATDPLRAWPLERHLAANVVDALGVISYAMGAWADATEPPRVARPGDAELRAAQRARAGLARRSLESDEWEEL